MKNSSRRSSGPVLPVASAFNRSAAPGGRFGGSPSSDTTSFSSSFHFASSSSCSFTSSSSNSIMHRSTSPTRVRFHAPSSPTSSVRFSIDRSGSPGRSAAVSARDQVVRKHNNNNHPLVNHHHHHHQNQHQHQQQGRHQIQKRTCLCSPTSHPGSFRCSMHKNSPVQSISYTPNRLAVRRSAMTNSLVRIGTVEGDLMKRALAALIRPSSHQIRRRNDFQPRPSRLSLMPKADSDLTGW